MQDSTNNNTHSHCLTIKPHSKHHINCTTTTTTMNQSNHHQYLPSKTPAAARQRGNTIESTGARYVVSSAKYGNVRVPHHPINSAVAAPPIKRLRMPHNPYKPVANPYAKTTNRTIDYATPSAAGEMDSVKVCKNIWVAPCNNVTDSNMNSSILYLLSNHTLLSGQSREAYGYGFQSIQAESQPREQQCPM